MGQGFCSGSFVRLEHTNTKEVKRGHAVSPESDYTYRDKTTGEQLSFIPEPDEFMVTFREGLSEENLNEIIRSTGLSVSQGFNFEHNFAAVQVPRAQDAEAADRMSEQLAELGNFIPVMVDQDELTRYFLPDEFTVQFGREISKERVEQIIREKNSLIVEVQRTPGYYTLAVPEGRGLFESIRDFADLEEVSFAEPSEVSFNSALAYIPDSPDFEQLWGLRNSGQTVNGAPGTAGADIDVTEAWDIERGHPDVVIVVIDTGADIEHSNLQANILPRGSEDWDFADPNNAEPEDTAFDSHGTHIAGTVAATDNGMGVIGVAHRCRFLPLRIDLNAGKNQNRADAINYVTQEAKNNTDRRYIINCSWRTNGDHAGVRNAIIEAVDNNIIIVFAAGNGGRNIDNTPQYPAVYAQVIAVAATDQQDRKSSISNFGTNVDVSAPGVNIYSTTRGGHRGFLTGTSMAAPHVSGLAALIWSRNRSLTNLQVRQTIEDTSDNIDSINPGFLGLLGRGRINARKALDSVPQF